jgi:hypothetical protein
MPIILAVEPDHKQAARLAGIVRHQVGAELVIGDTTERALDALGPRVPDMVLVPALLSPQDDASLAAALRVIAAAAHVRTLTIPVLGSGRQETAAGGLLSRWRRNRAESPEPDGCDPAVFAEQITAYLKEAAAERAELDATRATAAEDETAVAMASVAIVDRAQPEPATFETWPVENASVAAEAWDETPFTAQAQETTDAQEEIPNEDPVFDLSNELVALSPDAAEEHLFAGEPFGTYTLPPIEEIQPESPMVPEASMAQETQAVFELPVPAAAVVHESPVAFESPDAFEPSIDFDPPIVFEPPVVFESPIAFDSLVAFDSPVAPESPVAFESFAASESPVAFEPPVVLEQAAVLESPVAFEAPVVLEAPAVFERTVTFERAEVLELMAPVPMTPWRAWPPLEGVPIELPVIAAVAAAKPEVPDWSELMASLRQDMERRRGQDRPQVVTRKPRPKAAKPLVDEWGFFDPEQCGFSALLAKLDEITSP